MNFPVYLLVGKDQFLKKEFISELRGRLLPKGALTGGDFHQFSGKSDPWNVVSNFLRTAAFLSPKRLAVLQEADELDEPERQALAAYAENPSPTGVLVVVSEQGSAKKDPFLARLSQKAHLVNCYPPSEMQWPAWVQARAKRSGRSLSREAAFLLIERIGRDTEALDAALVKLNLFTEGKNEITLQDAESLVGRSVADDVWRLADAVLSKDLRLSLETLSSLLKEGTRGFEIVGALAGQFERLRAVGVLVRQGRSAHEIASELRVHPYYLEKILRQAGATPTDDGARRLGSLLECDLSIKTGRLGEKPALERLLLELCA